MDGLRVSKTVNGVTHTYTYASGKLLRETYGSNTLDFFYDQNGRPYALKYNGATYYYIMNLQGDVLYLLDSSKNVAAAYTYDPYGKILTATGTLANINPLRYRGYYYDTETGFYYLQSRYYDPTTCRFINADSFASTGQGILGHNMFAYCGNNPVNCSDPTGKLWGWVIAIVALLLTGCDSSSNSDNNINCYAYALRLEYDPNTGKSFSEQPGLGYFSNQTTSDGFYFQDPEPFRNQLEELVAADAKALDYYFSPVNGVNHVPAEGNWLIAFAYSNAPSTYGFHVWRQDEGGLWSHKPGRNSPTKYDDFGMLISDPKTSFRERYTIFVGYYEVGPNLGEK